MSADRKETSDKTDSHAQRHRHGYHARENGLNRDKFNQVRQDIKPFHHIYNRLAVQKIRDRQRNQRANQTDHHTLYNERRTDHEIRRTDQAHDPVFLPSKCSCRRDRIADKEDSNCQQNSDDHPRQKSQHLVEARKSGRRIARIIDLPDSLHRAKPCNHVILHVNVFQIDLVGRRTG